MPFRVIFTGRGCCCLGGSLRSAKVRMSWPVIGEMLIIPVGGAAHIQLLVPCCHDKDAACWLDAMSEDACSGLVHHASMRVSKWRG